MKNVKSTKTLMGFADSAMNISEMKKINGGHITQCLYFGRCPDKH